MKAVKTIKKHSNKIIAWILVATTLFTTVISAIYAFL